ncbi:hypothetical protein RYX36_018401 [Vicia faba]
MSIIKKCKRKKKKKIKKNIEPLNRTGRPVDRTVPVQFSSSPQFPFHVKTRGKITKEKKQGGGGASGGGRPAVPVRRRRRMRHSPSRGSSHLQLSQTLSSSFLKTSMKGAYIRLYHIHSTSNSYKKIHGCGMDKMEVQGLPTERRFALVIVEFYRRN